MTRILRNEKLCGHTTFRIGGPAQKLAEPQSLEELCALAGSGEITFVLGGGANILVSDSGVDGTVLRLGPEFGQVEFAPAQNGLVRVKAGAATRLTWLAGWAMRQGLEGLEFGFGIPGSLGGALIMNAGTNIGQMQDVTEAVTLVTREGREERIGAREAGFGYRTSSFPQGAIIAGAELLLRPGEKSSIQAAMRGGYMKRKASQPLDRPSAGSVYKNPPGDFAGRIIEACGLKGERIGDAMVSPMHANFIVNMGAATAGQVYSLMRLVEKRALERLGARLEREIKLVGRFDE